MKIISKMLIAFSVLITCTLSAQQNYYISGDFLQELVNDQKMELLPVTRDFRNYFILQSIGNQTNIIIGDFVGSERKIVLIVDLGNDNKIDRIYEYYPDSKKKIRPAKTTSPLFIGFEETKRAILDGSIYKNNYSYNMRSLDVLETRLKRQIDVSAWEYGWTVKVFDPDKPTTVMSEFFYQKRFDKYSLQFKTVYYKLYNTVIRTPVPLSVYCESSTDPMIAETVEKLLTIYKGR